MSKPGFTPGPWRVEEGTTLVWGACDPADRSTYGMGYPVAVAEHPRYWIKTGKPDETEREANARLIAAAPALYDALENILEWAFDGPAYDAAVAALSVARGDGTSGKQAYAGRVEIDMILHNLQAVSEELARKASDKNLKPSDFLEGQAAEAISSLLKALERIATHESHVRDSHMECENCKDAYLDDYAACKAIARAALNSDAPLSIGEGDRG